MTEPTLTTPAGQGAISEATGHPSVRLPTRDWRQVAGTFEVSDLSRQADAETLAIRERDRQAALEGREP